MKGVTFMQQKVNTVTVLAGAEEKVYEDVVILKGAEGLYVESSKKIGTDIEGNDLIQEVLTMYPWERVVSLAWTEKSLIESVKQSVILEALRDLEDFLEDYEDDSDEDDTEEDEEEDSTKSDKRDDPKVNPYK
jgi:hypothetical protein